MRERKDQWYASPWSQVDAAGREKGQACFALAIFEELGSPSALALRKSGSIRPLAERDEDAHSRGGQSTRVEGGFLAQDTVFVIDHNTEVTAVWYPRRSIELQRTIHRSHAPAGRKSK